MAESERLDNLEQVKKIDRQDMLSVVHQMPEMLVQAQQFSAGVSLPKPARVSQAVILGMGGSAIAGDILADLYLKKVKFPILTNRGYTLPEFVGPDTLVFALSYSGNTEETLTTVKESARRKSQIICITSGGKLKELAIEKKYPLFLIPSGYQPRAALPYLLVPLLASFEKMGLAESVAGEIKEAVALLQKLREEYRVERPARNNPAKQLARKLQKKIPLIFGTAGTTGAAAMRLKTQFNENGKATALLNLFSELNHNEIVNLSILKREEHNFFLLILRDEGDNERIKKRIEITKSLLVKQLGGAVELTSQGKAPLARILSLILLGDFLSVYLAILAGVDPTPVDVIERLKKELVR